MENIWQIWSENPGMMPVISLFMPCRGRMILHIPLSKARLRQWQRYQTELLLWQIMKKTEILLSGNRRVVCMTAIMPASILITA